MLVLVASRSAPAWDWHSRRLNDLLPDPVSEKFSLTARFRARQEGLDDQFRIIGSGELDAVFLRTLIAAHWKLSDGFAIGGEFQDSRAVAADNLLLSSSLLNAAELLRAYAEVRVPGVLGGTLSTQFGRMTMDVGSRRFVARNRYRNTINSFTGVDVQWLSEKGRSARAFWLLPVKRLRSNDNDIQFDKESLSAQFWGAFASSDLSALGRGELFIFGLHEEDSSGASTRNRGIDTWGLRLFEKPARASFDYTFELALQWGRSRATALASDATDLDHFAHFNHLEVGFTFDVDCAPRIVLQYDYASGDDDPNDGRNGRFDTLFGARRFDFGPTGIYGPFARANINTPGVRVQLKPLPGLTSFVSYRAFWLASDSDAWTTTGVRDPSGQSGSYIGSQIEFRIRWRILPGNLALETGYAHLFAGEFIDNAPNSNMQGDSNYACAQIVLGI